MNELRFFFDNLWLWKCNLPENQPFKIDNPDTLYESEWSPRFEKYMRNRLVMGALRYGKINAPNKPKYCRVESMVKRLNQYQKTGNLEILVDVANLCLLEFEEGNHPNKHFNALCENEHVKVNE